MMAVIPKQHVAKRPTGHVNWLDITRHEGTDNG